MGSSCCGNAEDLAALEEMWTVLEPIDFREIAEQARLATADYCGDGASHRKADRAEQLGLGGDVAALYRAAAERDDAQVRRQVAATLARLDDRTSRDDWGPLVRRMQQDFEERGQRTVVEEVQGRFRMHIFETNRLSGGQAARIAALADRAL